MQYFVLFLEGIITFISPCLLPMLPIYVAYFVGGESHQTKKTLKNALGFVLGFTLVFVAMGAFAGTIGSVLKEYQTVINIASGLVVVFLGLNFLGIFNLNLFRGSQREVNTKNLGFFSSVIFGVVFSISWTPCVGAFLGSALMVASTEGHTLYGMLLLLTYSMGLGIPFVVSALLIDQLKGTFDFIKRHYRAVNIISGALLVLVGIFMATGMLGRLLTFIS